MVQELTYSAIIKTLFTDGIEEYVPDGVSVTHPVIFKKNEKVYDAFLIFSIASDGKKYSAPSARIIIDVENRSLIEYTPIKDIRFDVEDNSKYYNLNTTEFNQEAENDYQESYVFLRKVAFSDSLSEHEKEELVKYLKAFKKVVFNGLQPYIIELSRDFFEWAKKMLE